MSLRKASLRCWWRDSSLLFSGGPTHARSGVGGQANIEILAGSSCMTGISPSIQYHKIYAIVNISLKSEIFQETSWPTGVTDAHQLRAGRFQRPSPSSWSWSWLS